MRYPVGTKVWVWTPGMEKCGYGKFPGIISEILPNRKYNIVRDDGQPVAFGQEFTPFMSEIGLTIRVDNETQTA